ncbi:MULTISPECIES: helix-turn-helix domain-containing protein [Candidatus Ichthyocystis]|uniref:Putative transcriptional regulator, HTH domain n=1 Tax=Candidatus Ichthyocystis hellenicum TaxID=1561003 RepID=A0A0S4M4W8_9BURK|nr:MULTISPECIES: helix-turn-helix domain-containing protein [Ichthyocystis]CUT18012.1 putative transcriptional regulator, HTH domain [Candidatus Ichthyocystis hellenicum]
MRNNTSKKRVNPREIRKKLGMNQQQFWERVGVTQSGGSRYESGRSMPKPVLMLLQLVHMENIDIKKLCKEDVDVIKYLKDSDSSSYKELKKLARYYMKENTDRI